MLRSVYRKSFGERLRQLRSGEGLRQIDLAQLLDVGRSTIANVERGHEAPSERVWQALVAARPEWADTLHTLYQAARVAGPSVARGEVRPPGAPVDAFRGGPFAIESVAYTYVFEESRSPGEIIETRVVKALESGARSFGLTIGRLDSPGLRVDQEALWGGSITDSAIEDDEQSSTFWRRFEFDHPLRIGQRHEFAIRSWMSHDPGPPGTAVEFNLTLPTKLATINLAFHGSWRPVVAWAYGPVEANIDPPIDHPSSRIVALGPTGVTARFKNPDIGPSYGLAWSLG